MGVDILKLFSYLCISYMYKNTEIITSRYYGCDNSREVLCTYSYVIGSFTSYLPSLILSKEKQNREAIHSRLSMLYLAHFTFPLMHAMIKKLSCDLTRCILLGLAENYVSLVRPDIYLCNSDR